MYSCGSRAVARAEIADRFLAIGQAEVLPRLSLGVLCRTRSDGGQGCRTRSRARLATSSQEACFVGQAPGAVSVSVLIVRSFGGKRAWDRTGTFQRGNGRRTCVEFSPMRPGRWRC